jgi:hypothetical protein
MQRRVFANQHELLFAAIRTEADVVDTIFVMFRFAIDDCTLRLEATLGLVSSLAVPPLAVSGRDADV